MLTDVIDQQLTEPHWELAHAVAKSLVIADADVNELQKTIAYLRSVAHHEDAVARYFKYLETLVSKGHEMSRSNQTQDYYRSLDITCSKYLKGRVGETGTLLQILGWAARLVKYYKNAGPIGEEAELSPLAAVPEESARQREIRETVQGEAIAVGQVVDATVTAVKGKKVKKVTYELFGTVKLTQKLPKNAIAPAVDAVVKVEITELREDGMPKKIKV